MAASEAGKGKVGILVGGGPAPGINGVIGSATIEAINCGLEVVGIYDGFKWLAQADEAALREHVRPLGVDDVNEARFRGGSILHTSRVNPTEDDAKMANVVAGLEVLGVDRLITIGGDDTAYSASQTSKHTQGRVRVAHVPKTIDNDLPLPNNMPTFGFRTARDIGGRLVGNLMEDARTTQRWYVVVAMGRSAGHLALGMGSLGGASITIIPEEFPPDTLTLAGLCDIIEGTIVKRAAMGRHYGVAVVAEGVGLLMQEELDKHPLCAGLVRDEHNHVRLSEVPLSLILKRMLEQRCEQRGKKATVVHKTIGYELRCADPISVDFEYVQQLGWGAVRYLLRLGEGRYAESGAMISIQAGEIVPIPFSDLIDPETGRTMVRRVNMDSDQYLCARSFMLRLEREDFADEAHVAALAAASGLSVEQFREKFAHVAGL